MKFYLQLSCFCLITLFGEILGQGVVRVVVEEDSDAILPCSPSTKEDLRSKLFDWKKDGQKEVFLYDAGFHYNNALFGQDNQFKGRVSHFENELEHSNASIKISKTKVSDSGNYSCIFPRLQPRQIFHIELVVERVLKDRSSEKKGAAKPSIKTVKSGNVVMLQCVVRGASPKPEVEWRNSAGNILHAEEPQVTERGGSYDIILKANVTKTNNYRCVITQEEISHRTEAETYIHISDPPKSESHTGLIAGVVVLSIALVVCGLYFKCRIKQISNREKDLEEQLKLKEKDLEEQLKLKDRMLKEERRKNKRDLEEKLKLKDQMLEEERRKAERGGARVRQLEETNQLTGADRRSSCRIL